VGYQALRHGVDARLQQPPARLPVQSPKHLEFRFNSRGLGLRAQGVGFRVQGLGFRV
jgi:hypothetical protein